MRLLSQVRLIDEALPPVSSTLSLILATVAAALLVVVLTGVYAARRRDREAFADLARRHGLEIGNAEDVARVEEAARDVFGEGPRVTEVLRQRAEGLEVYVVRLLMPLYRVDEDGAWDEKLQESQRKLVVVVSGFEGELPAFRLMPNNWALSTVRGHEDNRFEGVMPFGFNNYVLGRDKRELSHVLGGKVQMLLRDNRQMTVDGRRDYLAFYLQDIRESPRDLAAFVARCVEVAAAIGERVKGEQPSSVPVRHASPAGLG